MTTKHYMRALILLAIVVLVVLAYHFNVTQYLTLSYIKSQQAQFAAFYSDQPVVTLAIFALIYIIVTALSLPGAAVLTLAAGALFGLVTGTILVSFTSTIGATLAFLVSRFLLHDAIQNKYGHKLGALNEGLRKEGAFYLFTLRLIPIFPFFLINLVMGLTPIKTRTFYWVSQVGMLAGTIVYVNAGHQLSQLDSLQGILSPSLIGAFVLLGIFPLVAKKIINVWKKYRILRPYTKPKRFDYNMVVIGAGSGGLVAAYIGATLKAKVALIEGDKMGGDCLNTGCVPSKTLIRAANMVADARRATAFGLTASQIEFDFKNIMDHIKTVIHSIEPHDSIERYTQLGVNCYQGHAVIEDPYRVRINDDIITTKNIIIATGATPFVPPIPGLDQTPYLTSENLWQLETLPKRLVVLGGGFIGCELALAFCRLGSQVTLVEQLPELISREDSDVVAHLTSAFRTAGITVLTEHTASEFVEHEGQRSLICTPSIGTDKVRIDYDQVLVAIGRKASISGFGLEALGVNITERGLLDTDPFLRTNFPNIYGCGDVVGPYQLTHASAHQAWYAAINALFHPLKQFKASYRVMPMALFTDPVIARVGLNEKEADAAAIQYTVTTYDLADLDRAIVDGDAHGFIKVLTPPGKDKILGATIVGPHADVLIAEFVLAMTHNIGLNKILGTIHIYPTLNEANKYVAGNWKKAHAPEKLLRLVQAFHRWRRGNRSTKL